MAVIVTCRRGHVTHRSEIDADGRCETCARIDHAVARERERCAVIAEEQYGRNDSPNVLIGNEIAAAIREQK